MPFWLTIILLILLLLTIIGFLIKIIIDDYKTISINMLHFYIVGIAWYLFFFLSDYLLGHNFLQEKIFIYSSIGALILGGLSLIDNFNKGGMISIEENMLWFTKNKVFHPITAISDLFAIYLFFVFFWKIGAYLNLDIITKFAWPGAIIVMLIAYYVTKQKYNTTNLYYNIIRYNIKDEKELDTYLTEGKYIKKPQDFKETKEYLVKKEEMKKVFSRYENLKPWHIVLWGLLGYVFIFIIIYFLISFIK